MQYHSTSGLGPTSQAVKAHGPEGHAQRPQAPCMTMVTIAGGGH